MSFSWKCYPCMHREERSSICTLSLDSRRMNESRKWPYKCLQHQALSERFSLHWSRRTWFPDACSQWQRDRQLQTEWWVHLLKGPELGLPGHTSQTKGPCPSLSTHWLWDQPLYPLTWVAPAEMAFVPIKEQLSSALCTPVTLDVHETSEPWKLPRIAGFLHTEKKKLKKNRVFETQGVWVGSIAFHRLNKRLIKSSEMKAHLAFLFLGWQECGILMHFPTIHVIIW